MVRLSGWVREQNSAGFDYARIIPETAARVFQMRLPSLKERSARALSVLARLCNWQLHVFAILNAAVDLELQGLTYSRDYDELQTLLLILHNQGYTAQGHDVCQLTVAGLFAAEELCNPRSISSQGFVAMNFGDNLREAWANGFEPAIRAAGFRPFRIDNKDYVGGITDEIMAEIRRSRFVVADYTGQRGGVYFEAGFALGLGLTVIPTCRADEIGQLHFDIKHLNTLTWNTPSELCEALTTRIRAVIGAGPDP
jgi:hypothetical protein